MHLFIEIDPIVLFLLNSSPTDWLSAESEIEINKKKTAKVEYDKKNTTGIHIHCIVRVKYILHLIVFLGECERGRTLL